MRFIRISEYIAIIFLNGIKEPGVVIDRLCVFYEVVKF
jgi:hypothetical protein